MEEYKALGNTYELEVASDFAGPKTLQELHIRSTFLLSVVAIRHAGERQINLTPRSHNEIEAGDAIAVVGKKKNVHRMANELGWDLKDGMEVFAESLARTSAGMAETVVSPRSELIGKTMQEVNFKDLYNLNPIALFKGNRIYYTGLTQMALCMGIRCFCRAPGSGSTSSRISPSRGH